MIASTSYCRRLPRILDAERRLQIDSLVFAADIASLALKRFETASTHFGQDDLIPIEREVTAALFSSAWTIVDQVHIARRLIRNDIKASGIVELFYMDFESASLMRNDMDHIDSKIGNLSRRKARADPLFVSVSFTRPNFPQDSLLDAEGLCPITAFTVMLGESPTDHPGAFFEISTIPCWPIGNPVLAAFGQRLALDAAVSRLNEMIESISAKIEEQITRAIGELQVPNSERSYWSEAAGGDMVVAVDMLVPLGATAPSVRTGLPPDDA